MESVATVTPTVKGNPALAAELTAALLAEGWRPGAPRQNPEGKSYQGLRTIALLLRVLALFVGVGATIGATLTLGHLSSGPEPGHEAGRLRRLRHARSPRA